MFSKKIIFFFISISAALKLSAQCLTYPVSFADRANSSSVIVEGKIISQSSFWNSAHNFIYTSSQIELYKIFKGTVSSSQIVLLTEGGTVGTDMVIAEPSLKLFQDEVGIFFLQPSSVSNPAVSYPSGMVFEPYASLQGFIRYDLIDLKAHDFYNRYSNVNTQIYQPLVSLIGNVYQTISEFDINDYGSNDERAAPIISSITPGTTTAGTFAAGQITITGSNFGVYNFTNSKLEFPDANNGGAGYILNPANHIVSWTDNTIIANVVTGAGSGFVRITNATNETTTSGISLTVNYNETNVISGGNYYQPDLVNRNGSGGFIFNYNTTFNGNAPAVAAFERALQTWRCNTHVNFSRSGTTAIATQALDGTNVVTFDGSSALPAGVLGTSYSFYSSCATGVWYLNENDCKFRTNGTGGINWNYGPVATSGGLYDFESVTLHELGHSHQLGHTITPVTVMNYAIGPNTDRRTLTAVSEIAGGNDIMTRAVVTNSCGPTAMIALTASNCSINAPLANFSGTPTSGCNSITVNFTDLSSNTPTSWSWTFTGGVPATSTLQNPTIVYSTPGTYNVTLVATNASGSDTRTYSSYITVNSCPPPTAYFYGTPTTLCAGQQVAFFDTSTNSPTSWSWTFPGGTPATSTLQNPVVTYSAGGVFNVTLTATNAYGSNTLTRTNYITVNNCPPPPVANFTGAPTTLCAGNTVTYTDLSTNSPTSWSWSFPGGTPATSIAQNPVITYSAAGVYSATLVATNASGSNSFTRTNYITVNTCAAPVANFSGWPTTICSGQSVNFTDLSTNSPTSWSWTFPGGVPASSTAQNPTVNYAVAGSYNVTLTATNGFGNNTLTMTGYINVNSCPPTGTGLLVNDGSLIYVQMTGLITVQGGIINQDNGINIGNIDNRGQITLTGDWTNYSVSNAFINSSQGEVQMLGSSQLITGTTPTYFYNLTLLGTGIKTQTLDARTEGTLSLNDRELNTQDYVMYVTNPATAAVTRTGGFTSTPVQGFVSSTNNGRLWRNTNSTGIYLFPVGSSLVTPRYRPIEIKPSATAANTYGVRFVNNDPNANGFNRTLKDPNLGVVNGLWYQKLNHVSGPSTADITMYFDNTADAVPSVPSVLMTEWGFGVSPVQWRDMGGVTPIAAVSPALSKVTKTLWNTYTTENFNIAPQSIPLPVELVNLNATCTGNNVELTWSTASETNSDYFSVVRSSNGTEFEIVGIVPAAGNSSSMKDYSFTDNFSPRSTVYYKLVQTDVDGKSYSYGPIALNCRSNGGQDFADIYPNPFAEDFSLLLNLSESGNISVSITNTLGQTIKSFSIMLKKGTHQFPLSLADFAPGFYNLLVQTPSSHLAVKMVKEK